jgi:hypothetical protein
VKRRHGLLIAAVLGAAAVAGTSAMLQTVSLGADAKSASEKEIAKADMRLDRQEAKLRRAAKRRPPKLPEVHDGAPAAASAPAAPASAPAAAATPAAAPAAVAAPAPVPSTPVSSSHGGHDDDHEDTLEDRADELEDLADELEDLADDRAEAAEDLADERADALEDQFDD